MTKVTDKCPKCGSHLVIKDGQFGEFLACPRFPDCRYAKSVATEGAKLYKPPPEHFNPVRLLPEDFDFPMSETFREYSFEYCETRQ